MMIYTYWPNATGGSESQCRQLARALVRKGVDCTIITARTRWDLPAREDDAGCRVVRVPVFDLVVGPILRLKSLPIRKQAVSAMTTDGPRPGVARTVKGATLAAILRWLNNLLFMVFSSLFVFRNRAEIDIIHVHIVSALAGFAGWIGSRTGIPVICKGAFMPVFLELGRDVPFRRQLDRWRKRISFIGLTGEMVDEIRGHGIADDKVFLIHNGVDVPAAEAEPDSSRDVLYVGNFTQGNDHKAFDVLFSGWCEVASRIPGVRLVVAGRGDSGQWRKLLASKGCESSVQFLGRVDDMSKLYKSAAMIVLPSRSEGMSNALLEAQSWGLPAVVSDIPGNRAIVNNQVTGIVVPVGDKETFANAVIELLNDPAARKRMGSAARERIRTTFAMEIIAEKVTAAYRAISCLEQGSA